MNALVTENAVESFSEFEHFVGQHAFSPDKVEGLTALGKIGAIRCFGLLLLNPLANVLMKMLVESAKVLERCGMVKRISRRLKLAFDLV
jgi:hypothetical protein